jgi:hypothetical protein
MAINVVGSTRHILVSMMYHIDKMSRLYQKEMERLMNTECRSI